MDFRVLGPIEVAAAGRDLTPRRPRERALLALLVLRHPAAAGVEELIDAIWGERPPPTARTALQGLVSGIRGRLGAERIQTTLSGYRLRLLPEDVRDLDRFDALVADASGAGPAARVELLREALALFRGMPLEDVDLAIDLHPEVARLESRRLATQEAQIAAELELGRHVDAIPRLERLVAEQPLREGLRGQLMLALYRAGRQADALRVAQDARTVLATELGIEPGPALQGLERQILEQDPALIAPAARPDSPALVSRDGLATYLGLVLPPGGDAAAVLALATAHGGAALPSGRGCVIAFARAREAAAAAAAIQRSASRVSRGGAIGMGAGIAAGIGAGIGLDSGVAGRGDPAEGALRLARVAQPGQIVLSRATRDLLQEAPLHELDVQGLGEHRLADLGPRRPLYQLVAPELDVDFPPIRGLDDLPTNLPVQATALVDRASEIEEITALVREPGTRLVTLTGPGGTGKTRIAVHVAAELLDDAPDGIWFVPLDALGDPGLVGPTIAARLGVPSDRPDPLSGAIRELHGRRVLLVLDNFEHLLPSAGVVAALLEAAPGLKVLATSRVPLKLPGERVVPVPPLPVPAASPGSGAAEQHAIAEPEVGALLAVASVALFADRAAAAKPGFALSPEEAPAVASLCRVLDGLPLAIELAASRIDVLSPAAMLPRLDRSLQLLTARRKGGPERHAALEATIDWSHDLLAPDAQRLFAGLATFAGGWTLEGAEAVCADAGDVVAGLANLVDHSLVRVRDSEADPRFGMLETIREYASAKLDGSGRREAAERRHCSFFLALAESAEPELRGNPGPWLARLEAEHDNLRAALDRLARRRAAGDTRADAEGDAATDAESDAATEARLAGSLWRFWYLAGHLREGRMRLEAALSVSEAPTPIRLKVLLGSAVMAMNAGDTDAARAYGDDAFQLASALGDSWSAAYARFMLGNAARGHGDNEAARRSYEAALEAFQGLGDDHSALLVRRSLAWTLEALGDWAAATAMHQDNLRLSRVASNGRLEASSLGALATIAFDEGRVVDATLLLRESLRLHRAMGDRLDTAVDIARAARALAMGKRASEAATILGALSGFDTDIGVRGGEVAEAADEVRARLLRVMPRSDFDRAVREGAQLRLEEALDLALAALG